MSAAERMHLNQTIWCHREDSHITVVQDAGIDHLHLPTVDFLFAPSVQNLHRGVDFIAGKCFCLFSASGHHVCPACAVTGH